MMPDQTHCSVLKVHASHPSTQICWISDNLVLCVGTNENIPPLEAHSSAAQMSRQSGAQWWTRVYAGTFSGQMLLKISTLL